MGRWQAGCVPIEAQFEVDKGGQTVKKTAFYVRVDSTREITRPEEKQK